MAIINESTKSSKISNEKSARREAIKQINRRRHFYVELVISGIGMMMLVLIWAMSEYRNARGWPTQGFSQSSGIHDVWNYWIIYPIIGWAIIISARAWLVYGRKPITEKEIEQEIKRQAHVH